MTIQSDRSQDIDPNLRWEITELGRQALRDATPTGFPFSGNPVGVDELVSLNPFDLLPKGDPTAYCDGVAPTATSNRPPISTATRTARARRILRFATGRRTTTRRFAVANPASPFAWRWTGSTCGHTV